MPAMSRPRPRRRRMAKPTSSTAKNATSPTARLAFHNMPVPAENVLGQVGKGLRIALTVLDFGRTTFGASCTGVARVCLRAMVGHAKRRKQFKQTLSEFE